MYPVSQAYKDAIMQPSRQFRGRLLIPKLTMNFTRNSIAYKQDGTQVPANTPRFEQGRFGQAIMVEEGTTNLVSNGNCENDVPKLDNVSNAKRLDYSLSSDWAYSGSKSIKLTVNSTASEDNYYQMGDTDSMNGLTAEQTYTFSAYVYVPLDTDPSRVVLRFYDYANERYASSFVTAASFGISAGGSGRMQVTRTIRSGATAAFVRLEVRHAEEGKVAYFDAVQLEQKPYATSFIDGTRAAETLTIPTAGVLNPQEGTIEFWWNPLAKTPGTYPSLIHTGKWTADKSKDWLAIYWGSGWGNGDRVGFGMYNKNGTSNFEFNVMLNPQPYTRYYVVAKWSFATRIAKLIVYRPDGTYVSTQATINGDPPTFEGWDKFYVLQGWSNYWANSLIDDLRISNRAKSDEEILAAYKEVMG